MDGFVPKPRPRTAHATGGTAQHTTQLNSGSKVESGPPPTQDHIHHARADEEGDQRPLASGTRSQISHPTSSGKSNKPLSETAVSEGGQKGCGLPDTLTPATASVLRNSGTAGSASSSSHQVAHSPQQESHPASSRAGSHQEAAGAAGVRPYQDAAEPSLEANRGGNVQQHRSDARQQGVMWPHSLSEGAGQGLAQPSSAGSAGFEASSGAPILAFEIEDADGPLEGAASDLSSQFGRLKVSLYWCGSRYVKPPTPV